MPDNVRFLTWNDTGTPAKSSGANGFPAPFLSAGFGAYPYPIIVPFDQCIKWFWRVHKWAMATDASVTVGTTTAHYATGTMNGGAINSAGTPMTRELEHVAQAINGPGNFSEATNDGTSGSSGSLDLVLFTEFIGGSTIVAPSIVKHATDLYPLVRIAGSLNLTDGTNSVSLAFSSDPTALTPDGSIVATIDGVSITIYYQAAIVGAATFNITAMAFTPASYWPYASLADGSPVYDTATGSLLQDPTK